MVDSIRYGDLLLFFLIFLRIGSMLAVVPIFHVLTIPVQFRAGFAFFLSVIAFPVIVASTPVQPIEAAGLGSWILLALKEVMVGVSLGFVGVLVFSAFQMAGQLIDIQIGFAVSSVLDPISGVQSSLFGNLKNILATLCFLGMNGHHGLILGILQSFHYVPVGHFVLSGNMIEIFSKVFAVVMVLGVQMAAPVVVALLLTDVAFAILTRAVPQLNVFIVGLPFKLAIGLWLVILSMPALVTLFGDIFQYLFQQMETLLQAMVGSP